MKSFAELILHLDQSNKTGDKVEALTWFFDQSSEEDKIWAVAIFFDKKPKRQVSTTQLRTWCQEKAGIPNWLFEECYQAVGDLAETITLLLPPPSHAEEISLSTWIIILQALSGKNEEEKKQEIYSVWDKLGPMERFVFNKLITGGFRIGVSKGLVIKALSKHTGIPIAQLTHRLMGNWDPSQVRFEELLTPEEGDQEASKPYPFFLAHALEESQTTTFDLDQWIAEWKWDGIRGQVIRRNKQSFVWSRGEELVSDKFPELLEFMEALPEGTVLDGEILAFQEGTPLPFSSIQTRIGRKNLTKKQLKDAPVAFISFDLLEWEGKDVRNTPLYQRKEILKNLQQQLLHPAFLFSESLTFASWEELAAKRKASREVLAEGIMLKKKDSIYDTGRKRGNWWKWKIEPLTIDGVLLYAQKGHGRRADLYTDFTFAVWNGEALVPFAKAYSGLTDAELKEVDAFVKKHTKEKFGPVRTVKPELVFEIAFEGIQASPRHKSGIAVRFPRISRWRKDKLLSQANTLEDLKALLTSYG